MKIILGIPEFPPNYTWWGGVVFENLAKTYQKQWHEVLVISGDHTKNNIFSSLKKRKEQDTNLIRIPEFYTPISLLNTVMPYPFWYDVSLKKIIKNFAPDFVHIHGYGLFVPAQLGRICRKLGIDYTFTIHGAPVSPEKMKNPIISMAYNFYHTFYGFPLLDGAKRLTAVSSFARDFDIFKKYKDKIEIIGNGINPQEYKKVDFDIFEKRGIKKHKDTKIILSLGRIERIKWFEKIIALLPKMIQKWHNPHYAIAGRDNGHKKQLQTLAQKFWVSDRVHYLWFVEQEEKMSALQSTDIVAIPSETETYGMVALEARIFQKPVLTTFAGWLKDALLWYDCAFGLEDFEQALITRSASDKNISDFYWSKIWKQYLWI